MRYTNAGLGGVRAEEARAFLESPFGWTNRPINMRRRRPSPEPTAGYGQAGDDDTGGQANEDDDALAVDGSLQSQVEVVSEWSFTPLPPRETVPPRETRRQLMMETGMWPDYDPVLIGDSWVNMTDSWAHYFGWQYEWWPVNWQPQAQAELAPVDLQGDVEMIDMDMAGMAGVAESEEDDELSDSELMQDLELARRHGLPIDEVLAMLPGLLDQGEPEDDTSVENNEATEEASETDDTRQKRETPESDSSTDSVFSALSVRNEQIDIEESDEYQEDDQEQDQDSDEYLEADDYEQRQTRRRPNTANAGPRAPERALPSQASNTAQATPSTGQPSQPVAAPGTDPAPAERDRQITKLPDAPSPSCVSPGVALTAEELLTFFPRMLKLPDAVLFVLCADEKWASASAVSNFVQRARGIEGKYVLRSSIGNQILRSLKLVTRNRRQSVASWAANHRRSTVRPPVPWDPEGVDIPLVEIGRNVQRWPTGAEAGAFTAVTRWAMEVEEANGSCEWMLSEVATLSQSLP